MAIINVSGAGQLMAALDDARPGDTLRLAAGNYGTVELDGTRNPGLRFAGDVTVTSANPGAPAVFNDLTLRNVSNLNFENIDFTAVGGRTSGDLVTVTQSRGITINNSDFDGRQIGGVQNGLSVTNSSDVQISNSEFDDFYYGAGFRIVDNLRILNNNIHSMDFDGLRLAQVTNTLIQGNRLHDMDGPVDGGHRDMIQFWTAETSAPSANVTIRDNTMDIGDGRMIQSLFIYNEAVLREGAGAEHVLPELPDREQPHRGRAPARHPGRRDDRADDPRQHRGQGSDLGRLQARLGADHRGGGALAGRDDHRQHRPRGARRHAGLERRRQPDRAARLRARQPAAPARRRRPEAPGRFSEPEPEPGRPAGPAPATTRWSAAPAATRCAASPATTGWSATPAPTC